MIFFNFLHFNVILLLDVLTYKKEKKHSVFLFKKNQGSIWLNTVDQFSISAVELKNFSD